MKDIETVILVDEQDKPIGTAEKMQAHEQGLLHRAFSVFVFNDQGKLLLQQRSSKKYHSPLLWTNTCCSHPRPGENTSDAAQRRCREEMGIELQLQHAFSFIYNVALDQGLTEHEYDHVFLGQYNKEPIINADEVADYKWISLQEVKDDLTKYPSLYTTWFKICIDQVIEHYKRPT